MLYPKRDLEGILEHLQVITSHKMDEYERIVCEMAGSCEQGGWMEGAIAILEHWSEKHPENEVCI